VISGGSCQVSRMVMVRVERFVVMVCVGVFRVRSGVRKDLCARRNPL